MYRLTGVDENGHRIILDDQLPDDWVAEHDAQYCAQYWTGFTDFELTKIEVIDD